MRVETQIFIKQREIATFIARCFVVLCNGVPGIEIIVLVTTVCVSCYAFFARSLCIIDDFGCLSIRMFHLRDSSSDFN